MKLPVFDTTGKKLEAWNFDEKSLGSVNEVLLAQAIRVYESNSHQGTSKVKTRGEVNGSTKKIYRQKGTGNARHGARYAPIFVGGGIAFGPTGDRPANLVLPKKMRARALSTSLLLKLNASMVSGIDAIEAFDGKAASAAKMLSTIAGHPQKRVLVVTGGKADNLYRGLKNLQDVTIKQVSIVNAYDLVYFHHVVLTKEALDSLVARATRVSSDSKSAINAKGRLTAKKTAKESAPAVKAVAAPKKSVKKPAAAKTSIKTIKSETKKNIKPAVKKSQLSSKSETAEK